MPGRGQRKVFRLCACGCGDVVQPYIHPVTKRNLGYRKFIPRHGHKDWGKRFKRGLAKGTYLHPSEVPAGTRSLTDHGYIKIKCRDGKWRYEHRVIAKAKKGQVVHHMNHDGTDNRPENLQKMTNSAHTSQHGRERRRGQWAVHYVACIDCGLTERPHSARGRCNKCHQRHIYVPR